MVDRVLELEQQLATLSARSTDLATQLVRERAALADQLAALPSEPP